MLGYDSDDDSRRSPYTLEQVHPRITPPDSPAPPDPPRSNNPSMPAGHQTQQPGRPGQKSARARRRRHLPSQGDQVLLLASYPNRPDIAREAGQKVLLSDSDNDDGDDDAEHSEGAGGPSRGPVARSPSPGVPTRTSTTATLNPLFNAMNAMGSSSSFDERDGAPESAWAKGKAGVEGATGMERSQDGEPPRKRTSISDKTPIRNLKQSDSIAASPALQPFLLSGPRGASGMQMLTESPTPSRTSTMPVEPAQQMLPSVKSLIHEVDSNEQHGAYARPRATSLTSVKAILEPAAMIVSSQTAPLPVAPIQAANQRIRSQTESLPQTDPRLYRPPSSAGQKRPYQNHQQRGSVSSTGSTLMPHASSVTTVSPSATTPSLIRDASPQTSPTDDGRRRSGDDAQSAGPNTLTYKCHYPGCTAAPFLTQYLLNSHKNVHSEDRPYYCTVAGCARSEGGKGFKRRNEMLRHGLVHNSPGFICPFCGDGREHRYPRPDNLLRHVRMHHKNESTDDDRLRAVLVQRRPGPAGAGGGGRGRRRRDSVAGHAGAEPGVGASRGRGAGARIRGGSDDTVGGSGDLDAD